MNAGKMSGVIALCLVSAVGCKKERSVEMTLTTSPREGQLVQNEFIELEEGQALGVRIVGKKKDKLRPRWSVEGRSENLNVARIQPTAEKEKKSEDGEVFVVSGVEPGQTKFVLKLKGKHEVTVDAIVLDRPDWTPTVPPANFGGASSE